MVRGSREVLLYVAFAGEGGINIYSSEYALLSVLRHRSSDQMHCRYSHLHREALTYTEFRRKNRQMQFGPQWNYDYQVYAEAAIIQIIKSTFSQKPSHHLHNALPNMTLSDFTCKGHSTIFYRGQLEWICFFLGWTHHIYVMYRHCGSIKEWKVMP